MEKVEAYKFNDKEMDLISHTLGINITKAVNSKKKKDKKLPKDFYRNYFCFGTTIPNVKDEDYKVFLELEKSSLVIRWGKFDNLYFSMTDYGIKAFKQNFLNLMEDDNI